MAMLTTTATKSMTKTTTATVDDKYGGDKDSDDDDDDDDDEAKIWFVAPTRTIWLKFGLWPLSCQKMCSCTCHITAPASARCHIQDFRPGSCTGPGVPLRGAKAPSRTMASTGAGTWEHASKWSFSGFLPVLGGRSMYKNRA